MADTKSYALSVLQEGPGNDFGDPLAVANARTVNINPNEIDTIEADTTVANCVGRITMKRQPGETQKKIYYTNTAIATIRTAINV